MANLAKALERLRDETSLSRYRLPVGVASDIRELLRDYDRLDATVRMMYPPHVEEMRRALHELRAAHEQVSRSLSLMAIKSPHSANEVHK